MTAEIGYAMREGSPSSDQVNLGAAPIWTF